MNSFLQAWREQFPEDSRSDEDLILSIGGNADLALPDDFKADYQKLVTAQNVEGSSVGQEFSKGLTRGVQGLKAAGAGALALTADVLGAPYARDWYADMAKAASRKAAEEAPPSVPGFTSIRSLSGAAQWAAGEAGALVPNLAEAGVAGAIGAVEGSALGPAGAVAGGAVGGLRGLIARSAAKVAIKRITEEQAGKLGPKIMAELGEYATGKRLAKDLSEKAFSHLDQSAKLYGSTMANIANFGAQGAGGVYGALQGQEGLDRQTLMESAAIAGLGSGIGALIPAQVFAKLFPGIGESAAKKYVADYAKQIPVELMSAGGGMGAMEFFNILAEKHADPKERGEPFTTEDYHRMANAVAVGVLAGTPAAGMSLGKGIAAGRRPGPEVAGVKPPVTAPPREPLVIPLVEPQGKKPAMTPEEQAALFPATNIEPDRLLQMRQIAAKELLGTISEDERAYLDSLSGPEQIRYQLEKKEVSDAIATREKSKGVSEERQGTDEVVQGEAENRIVPPEGQGQGAEPGAGGGLRSTAEAPVVTAKEFADNAAAVPPAAEPKPPEPTPNAPIPEPEVRAETSPARELAVPTIPEAAPPVQPSQSATRNVETRPESQQLAGDVGTGRVAEASSAKAEPSAAKPEPAPGMASEKAPLVMPEPVTRGKVTAAEVLGRPTKTEPDARKSTPAPMPMEPGDPKLETVARDAIQRLRDVGIPTEVIHARSGEIYAAVKESLPPGTETAGKYDRIARTVTWLLRDATAPTRESWRVLVEEVGHALFAHESPEIREPILRAMMKLADRDFGLSQQQLADIRNAYPKGARGEVVAEEALMAIVSSRLVAEGFIPSQSRGIAQAIVRVVKDIYLKGLMWVQQTFLGEGANNADLAQRFFQNRLESFLAGDRQSLSWIDRLGGAKPSFEKQASWQTPLSGDTAFATRFDPTTGLIHFEPMVSDSLQAVMLNLDDRVRYSTPAGPPGAPPNLEGNRLRKYNLEQSIANLHLDLHDRLSAALKVGADNFRTLFNLKDPQTITASLYAKALRVLGQGHNMAQQIADFTWEGDWGHAYKQAWAVITRERSKVAEKVSNDKVHLEAKKEEYKGRVEEDETRLAQLDNTDYMQKDITRSVKDLLRRDLAANERANRELGGIQEIAQHLGPESEATIPQIVNALQKLYTGHELEGSKLYELVNHMAHDTELDFSRPAPEIARLIRRRAEMIPEYQPYQILRHTSPEGRALMATIIAYGKLNGRRLVDLELRTTEGRAGIIEGLKRLKEISSDHIERGVPEVARSATLKERAKAAYMEFHRDTIKIRRQMDGLKTRIALGEGADPFYKSELDRITGKIGVAKIATFENGMQVDIPTADGKFEPKTITTISTQGKQTTPKEIEGYMEAQTEFLAAQDKLFAKGDETAHGAVYQNIRQQRDVLFANRYFDAYQKNVSGTTTGIMLSSIADWAHSFGTAAGRAMEVAVNRFVSNKMVTQREMDRLFGNPSMHLMNKGNALLNEGRRGAVAKAWYIENVLDRSLGFLEKLKPDPASHLSMEQQRKAGFTNLRHYLAQNKEVGPVIAGREDRLLAVLEDHVTLIEAAGQHVLEKLGEGSKIKDPTLFGNLRREIPVGLFTMPRKLSKMFPNMVNALTGSKWITIGETQKGAFGDFKNYADASLEERAAMIDKYFYDPDYRETIDHDFLYPLFHNRDESFLWAPRFGDDTVKVTVEPTISAEAYAEAGGRIVETLTKIWEKYGGTGDASDYVQEGLMKLAEEYNWARSTLDKVDPKATVGVSSLKGLVPSLMLDARQFTHKPVEWFSHHHFDPNDNSRVADSVAGFLAFGREGSTLAAAHEALTGEVESAQAKLRQVTKLAEDDAPSRKRSAMEAAMIKRLAADNDPMLRGITGGKERLKYLRRMNSRAKFVDAFRDGLVEYFRRNNDQTASLKWGIRLAQEISWLLVNQPASAISQLSTVFDMPIQWGASPMVLKATGRFAYLTAKDIAGSLVQAVGFKGAQEAYYERMFRELNLREPEISRKLGDILATQTGEENSRASRYLRIMKEGQAFTVNPLGTEARYTLLRPLAPFFQLTASANRALTVTLFEMASNFVGRGVEYVQDNGGIIPDAFTPEMLGFRGLDKKSFELWQADAKRFGLDIRDMVKRASERLADKNGERVLLDRNDMIALYGLGLSKVSLESNIGTTPISSYNNNVLRFIMPLQGWPMRRAVQLAGRTIGPNDKRSLDATGRLLLGLSTTAFGGLAVSLAVDWYQEELLGKKRNIRDLRVPMTGNDWVAIQERLNRQGTFGLWGNLLNSAVNVGTGQGDNRDLSMDQRVVGLQAFQGMLKSVRALINQDLDADYKSVVRPAVAAIGGNGFLQYMQLANRAFDLNNVESQTVKRLNAENYLRVVGRDLGMDIRGATGGGYGTPTPMTPWIGRMEMAVWANDPVAFREAWLGAKAEAKAAGKEDPIGAVKTAFAAKHPLKYVFSIAPTEPEYKRILGELDERGKESVQESVRLFNYYGAHLGISPFMGKPTKTYAQKAATAERRLSASMRVPSGYSTSIYR